MPHNFSISTLVKQLFWRYDIIYMKNHIQLKRYWIIFFACMPLLFACKPPFKVGLGDKVDLENPEITIQSHESGEYIKGETIFSGTHSDDFEVERIQLSLDGGITFLNAEIIEENWEYSIDSGDYPDGSTEIIILVTDKSGKSLEKRLLLYFDNTPPTVVVNQPVQYAYSSYNGDLSIKGDAADKLGVGKVYITVLDSSGTVLADSQEAEGKNSWSYLFPSADYIDSNGTLRFSITALDNAGNESSILYHNDDLYAVNNNSGITVEEVVRFEAGENIEGVSLDSSDLAGIALEYLSITFDQDTDIPVFVISNPDAEAPADKNILPGNAAALGMAIDDDGIDTDGIEVAIDGGSWEEVDETTGSGLSVRFEHDLSHLTDGNHTIMFRAADIYGAVGESSSVPFLIDRGAPSITVTSPRQGEYINSRDFICTGTAADGDSVAGVEVSIDGGLTYEEAEMTGNDWSFPVSLQEDGTVSIKVRAEDGTGKTAYYNLQVIVDTQSPELVFIDPAKSSSVNGEVLLKGTSSDNAGITNVEIKIGETEPWLSLEGLYNWEYAFDSQSYTGDTHSEESPPGSGVWKLTIQARAYDLAGNEGSSGDYFLYIDNDLDKPTVSIASPPDGQSVGGAVLVTGTAFDDDAVFRIEMQADINNDGDYSDQFDLDGDGNTSDFLEDEGIWYVLDGTTLWSVQLNNSGELYHVEAGHTGNITLRVRAVDTKDGINPDTAGNYQELSIRFDDSIPRVENMSHASGDYVNEEVSLTADILDDEEVSSISISYDGGISYTDITDDPGMVTQNSPGDYDFHVTFDTAPLIPDSGVLYLRIKVVDNADYQTLQYINLNVDNTYPAGAYTGNSDDIHGEGASSRLQGTATDSGTVSGIERIELYLMRDGTVLSPAGGIDGTASLYDFGTTTGLYPDESSYILNINNHSEFGDDDGGNGDSDGFDESITISGSDYLWWIAFNSTLIADGELDIHYVVYDNAENGTHFTESGFIKNNKPEFMNVVAGTDLNADGDSADAGERSTFLPEDLPDTGYTAVNNTLYVELNAQPGGNTPLSYSLKLEGTDPELIQSGNSAAIDTTGYSDGPAAFTLQLIDNVGIITQETLEIEIDNTDDVDPSIIINPLALASVKGHGTENPEGHIELQNESLFDGPDPDVSGTVIFAGNVSDNQRISNITVQIPEFDAGNGTGASHTAAEWDQGLGVLVSRDANFIITNQSLTEAGGHYAEWEYEWNSAGISDTADNDVSVSFATEDASGRLSSDSVTVDVVPYIKHVETNLSTAFGDDFSRSAKGNYTVQQGEVLTVAGYNLNPEQSGADSDVRLSIDPDALNSGIKQGDPLTYSGVAADYTSLSVTVDAAGSGCLTIITSGIGSTNNINENSAEQNTIDSQNHQSLADDTFLSVWEYTDLSLSVSSVNHAEYPSMALVGDTPAFAYVNNSEGFGQAKYILGTADNGIYNNWDLFTYTAIDFNDEGSHGVLYDINVVNGNYGDYNSGNYGGIITSFFYDVPAHSWNPGAYYYWDNCVWLDNLVDTESPFTTAVLDRYQFPDLHLTGTDLETTVFYTAYDKMENRIIFRTYRVGTDSTIGDVSGGRINDSGIPLYTDIPQYNRNGNFPLYDGTNNDNKRFINSNEAGENPAAADGARVTVFDPADSFGKHTAVAGTEDGSAALIVYYDEAGTGSLVYRYNETPGNSGSWSDPLGLDTASGAKYIDMEIDSLGRVHIAYYDSYSGDVSYIRLNSYSTETFTKVTVDSYLIVGDKLSMTVNESGVPYLTYKGIGNSARAAWLTVSDPADGVDDTDRFNGNWEVQTLPVQMEDSDSNRFSVGIRSSDDMPVVGYTDDGLQYQRLYNNLAN